MDNAKSKMVAPELNGVHQTMQNLIQNGGGVEPQRLIRHYPLGVLSPERKPVPRLLRVLRARSREKEKA